MGHLEAASTERESRHAEAPSGGQVPLRLAAFDWTGFVANHFSLSLAGGTFTTGIGLILIDPVAWPQWLVLAVPISGLSLALAFSSLLFAFTRVWKTIREEHETSPLWDDLVEDVSPRGTGMENVRDAVFEIPYLFSILVLPFSVVCFQALAACLVLFYACDNYYNLALVRRIGGDECVRLPGWLGWAVGRGHRVRRSTAKVLRRVTPGHRTLSIEPACALLGAALATACSVVDPMANRQPIDRLVLARFFGRRARLNILAIWLLLAALAAVTILAVGAQRDWALGVGLVVVLVLLVLELVVEPFRSLGVQYEAAEPATDGRGELLLWTVPPGANLDDATWTGLKELHEEAFEEPERQYSATDIVQHAGRGGCELLVLTERDPDAGPAAVAGYVFLEARPEHDVAYLWYLAIASARRGHGLGGWMVRLALEVVHDRWPSLRAVFLETSHPSAGDPAADAADDLRRVQFYGRIGFSRVRGLEYLIPAEGDPERSLRYDPMFVALRGANDQLDNDFVKAAVLEMARDNFEGGGSSERALSEIHDWRWTGLRASLAGIQRVEPEDVGLRSDATW